MKFTVGEFINMIEKRDKKTVYKSNFVDSDSYGEWYKDWLEHYKDLLEEIKQTIEDYVDLVS